MDSGRSHCGWQHGSESIRLTSWRSPGSVRRFDLGNQSTQFAISCRFSGKIGRLITGVGMEERGAQDC